MTMLPMLPLIPGESLTSYMNRAARFHGNVSLPEFLDMIELSQQELLGTLPETIERLSRLTGLQTVQLERMTFLRGDKWMRSIGGHVVHSDFIDTLVHQFCPACLLEDLEPDSPSGGLPVGRIEWQIKSVHVCSRHNLFLKERPIRTYPDRFRNLPAFFEDVVKLRKLAAETEECTPSSLQKYILNRVLGMKGPAWLDDHPLDRAVKTCELLGMLLIDKPLALPNRLSLSQQYIVGQRGYEYASAGASGVWEAFQVLYDRHVERQTAGRAQKVFGRLYTWLLKKQHYRDPGPIRGLLREFILDHFPVEEGVELMGATVDRQRVHTARSLVAKTEFHMETVRRALVTSGLIADEKGNGPLHQIFEATAGLAVVDRMRNSISTKGLETYLNCTRRQAEQLSRSGVMPRLVPVGEACSGILTNVALEDAEAFLAKLMGNAVKVAKPSKGFVDIAGAAEVLHRPALDIVVAILDGVLERVETCKPTLKFKSLYVHPDDLRRALMCEPPPGFLTVGQVAKKLGVPPDSIYALSAHSGADGKLIFSEHQFENSAGAKQRVIDADEVDAFSARYITLKECSEIMGVGSRGASKKLKMKGISTIASRRLLLRAIYNRQEVLGLVNS